MTSQQTRNKPEIKLYANSDKPCVFRKSREAWGAFSNMTGGFPVAVNGIRFQSSEGLYQALKQSGHTERQLAIARQTNGWHAKQVQRSWPPYPEWEDDRIDAMRVALAFKLAQNPRFATTLTDTGARDIVESSYKDTFWGARPVTTGFRGVNMLGQLLMELRQATLEHPTPQLAAQAFVRNAVLPRFVVNGKGIDVDLLQSKSASRRGSAQLRQAGNMT